MKSTSSINTQYTLIVLKNKYKDNLGEKNEI